MDNPAHVEIAIMIKLRNFSYSSVCRISTLAKLNIALFGASLNVCGVIGGKPVKAGAIGGIVYIDCIINITSAKLVHTLWAAKKKARKNPNFEFLQTLKKIKNKFKMILKPF
jgi:hypothetical protein